MGVEYRLFKEKPEKEAFDLEKGLWYKIFPYHEFFIWDAAKSSWELAKRIRNEVYPDNENIDKEYTDWLACHLIEWAGHNALTLEIDTSADMKKWRQYRITADRFYNKYVQTEEEFNKDLESHKKLLVIRRKEKGETPVKRPGILDSGYVFSPYFPYIPMNKYPSPAQFPDYDRALYEVMTDEKGNKVIVPRARIDKTESSNSGFTTFDTSAGHCGLCGSISCRGRCFK